MSTSKIERQYQGNSLFSEPSYRYFVRACCEFRRPVDAHILSAHALTTPMPARSLSCEVMWRLLRTWKISLYQAFYVLRQHGVIETSDDEDVTSVDRHGLQINNSYN